MSCPIFSRLPTPERDAWSSRRTQRSTMMTTTLFNTGATIGAKFASVDALLFGRRTFDVMATAWPERAGA